MSKIQSFNRPALKSLRVSLDAALAKVAAEHGISISAGNIFSLLRLLLLKLTQVSSVLVELLLLKRLKPLISIRI
jgi:hypothetical protein